MGLTRPRAHQFQDLDYKSSVRVITKTNITLSGGAPNEVDGVSLSLADRILVAGQTDASENGLYSVTTVGAGSSGTWSRTTDGDDDGDITAGMVVNVTEGTAYADTQWKLTTDDPITIGTTNLTFAQASAYAFGTIAVAGQDNISSDTVGDTLTVAAGNNIVLTTTAGSDTLTIAGNDTPTFQGFTLSGNVTGNVLPSANVTYNLGSDTARWNELFLAGNTISLGSIQIKDSGGEFQVFQSDGSTPAQITGNIAAANVVGTVSSATTAGTVTTAAQPNITSVGSLTSLTVTGNVGTGNVSGTLGAFTTVTGNGRALTSLDASNLDAGTLSSARLSGSYSISVTSATTAGTVTTAAQPNITSLGTLSSLNVTGNVDSGNLNATGLSGTLLTASQTNITAVGTLGSLNVTGNIDAGNVNADIVGDVTGNVTGSAATVTTAAQPNITSVGTLSSLNVTGNVSAGNVDGTRADFTNLVGTLETATQTNITSVGTLNSLSVTGNISAGNIDATLFVGDVTGNVTGNVTGTADTATTAGTVTTAAQPNITSVGTLSSLTTSGDATIGGNLTVNGTTTTLNSTTLTVDDKQIVIASGAADATAANGAGISIDGAIANITYVSASNVFSFTHAISGNGEPLINLNASNLASGTVPDARISTSSVEQHEANLSLATSQVTSGTFSNARISSDSVTQHQANLSITESQISDFGTYATAATTLTAGTGLSGGGDLSTSRTFALDFSELTDMTANISGATEFIIQDGTTESRKAASEINLSAFNNDSSWIDGSSLNASNLDSGTVPTARLSGSYSISVDSATTAGTVTTASQPNITSTGTLTSLTVTGNVSSGNVSGTTGAFTTVTGNGRALTSLDASNLDTGTVSSARLSGSYDISVTSATTAGTVTTASQPNITSVGTLSSLTTSGDATIGGNLTVNGTTTTINSTTLTVDDKQVVIASGAADATAADGAGISIDGAGANITYVQSSNSFSFTHTLNGNGAGLTNINASNISSGTIPDARIQSSGVTQHQGNITSVGTLGSLTVSGNISSGNTSGTTATFTNLAGTLTTSAQPNITSVGTLTSVTISGNVSGGNISTAGNISAGNISTDGLVEITGTVASNIVPDSDSTYSLGNATNRWTNLFLTGDTIALGNLTIKDTEGALGIFEADGVTPAAIQAAETSTEAETFVDGADFGAVDDDATVTIDLGVITDGENVEIDIGFIVQAGLLQPDQVVFPNYTVSTVPVANPAGQMIYVSDESGGAVMAFSDGTNWRRLTDRAVIS